VVPDEASPKDVTAVCSAFMVLPDDTDDPAIVWLGLLGDPGDEDPVAVIPLNDASALSLVRHLQRWRRELPHAS
jgi:hypothetical protein